METSLYLLFAVVGTVLTVGPQALVDMVVYPVVGVAAVFVAAFVWERLATVLRRSSQRLPLLRANRARTTLFQTSDTFGRSVG